MLKKMTQNEIQSALSRIEFLKDQATERYMATYQSLCAEADAIRAEADSGAYRVAVVRSVANPLRVVK